MSTGRAAHETVVEGPAEVEAEAVEDWRAEIQRRLDEISKDVLGLGPSRRTFKEICKEIEVLMCVVAWFDERANITAASKRCAITRKMFRDRVHMWRDWCPHLIPQPPPRRVRTKEEAAEARRERSQAKRRAELSKKRAEPVAQRWAEGGTAPEGGQ